MPSAWVPGEPVGKGRPRMGRGGRVYTPDATRRAEHAVARAWWAPMIEIDFEIAVRVTAYYGRPKDHFLQSGALSAKGRRSIVPMKTPDLDNVVKLVLDALNGVAYRDDKQVQSVEALRFWDDGDDGPGVLVQVRQLTHEEIIASQARVAAHLARVVERASLAASGGLGRVCGP